MGTVLLWFKVYEPLDCLLL